MLKKLFLKYFLNSTLSSLKGKKRWLVILVLAVAYAAQSLGIDSSGLLESFVADATNLLNIEGLDKHNAEG